MALNLTGQRYRSSFGHTEGLSALPAAPSTVTPVLKQSPSKIVNAPTRELQENPAEQPDPSGHRQQRQAKEGPGGRLLPNLGKRRDLVRPEEHFWTSDGLISDHEIQVVMISWRDSNCNDALILR